MRAPQPNKGNLKKSIGIIIIKSELLTEAFTKRFVTRQMR